MKKTINFSDQQIASIEKICEEKAISFSEMIKRLVDEHLERINQDRGN